MAYIALHAAWRFVIQSETKERMMTLSQAIYILATVHTREDPITGFVILSGAAWRPLETPFSHVEYFEAWKVMREQSGMTVEPNAR